MRYAISGLPRCRSAWLSAVLMAHGSECYHDHRAHNKRLSGDYGISDPIVSCLMPRAALRSYRHEPKVAILTNDPLGRLARFDEWGGSPTPKDTQDLYLSNHKLWVEWSDHQFNVEQLDDSEVVGQIVEVCTGISPNLDIINAFQILKIEEHLEKFRNPRR